MARRRIGLAGPLWGTGAFVQFAGLLVLLAALLAWIPIR
jgi:hypothetical protein